MRLQYLTDEGIQYLKGNFEANLPRYIQRDSAYFADLLKNRISCRILDTILIPLHPICR